MTAIDRSPDNRSPSLRIGYEFGTSDDGGADAVVDLDAEPRMADLSYRVDPEVFTTDRIHPSDGGYALLAGLLAPAVRRVAGQ